MFAVPFTRNEEWNGFRRRAVPRRSVVDLKPGASDTDFLIEGSSPEQEWLSASYPFEERARFRFFNFLDEIRRGWYSLSTRMA